jgi:hypothetical protein
MGRGAWDVGRETRDARRETRSSPDRHPDESWGDGVGGLRLALPALLALPSCRGVAAGPPLERHCPG